MRVIAGIAKGRALKGPHTPDRGSATVRPTSDKVRGALFDMIGDEIVGARVLDLYAGTGALAIEALSRGAASADLVESSPKAIKLIEANLSLTGLEASTHLWRQSVERSLEQLPKGYDVLLADPPYADRRFISLLAKIGEIGLVRDQGLVTFEHSSRMPAPDEVKDLKLLKHRRHGDSTISLYRVVRSSLT